MRSRRTQRGGTLIEAMTAMFVLMVGAAGLVGLQKQSVHFMGDSRRTTRASAFAQDLINQFELWDYDDPRLENAVATNDADLGDSAMAFQFSKDPVDEGLADHGEADLEAGGKIWNGLPSDLLVANQMERFWNVSDADDYNGNGVPDAKRIAVVIRWQSGASWRRAVFMTTKINTADLR